MDKIKYIGYYNDFTSDENRVGSLAAINKMNYISKVLKKINKKVLIISPSTTLNKNFYKGKLKIIEENIELKLFMSFPNGILIQRILMLLSRNIFIFFYLILNIKRNEEIIVYHSLGLMNIIKLVKKITRCKIIMEVEEIYTDVINKNDKLKQKELDYFNLADKYIFPTEMLNKKINNKNKPYSLIYGIYNIEKKKNKRFNDNKIHIVYSGTFDPRKGVLVAIDIAEYLLENYHIHIIGFGSKEDENMVIKRIDKISKRSKAKITYDGLFFGKTYTEFLQKCDIGLSTQDPKAKFNESSFPSKILSYMANGLRVLSVKIPAIINSEIGKHIYYYNEQEPKIIAEKIMEIDLNDNYDSRKIINKLDEKFKKNIKVLLED